MELSLDYLPYRRRFVQPLRTAHGPWQRREGLLLRLSLEDGRCGYGEIAPLPWFGTETLAGAIALLHQLPAPDLSRPLSSTVETWLPADYPATAFGLGLALAQLHSQGAESAPWLGDRPAASNLDHPRHLCALLPSGRAALGAWPALYAQGHRTFKWKIGLAPPAQEQADLAALGRSLPRDSQLRLDGNASLDRATAETWLDCCDHLAAAGYPIEFLEQPLPPTALAETIALGERYRTPLALDESVATLDQLKQCHHQGWRGIVVIKGAIAGAPQAVLAWCQEQALDVVWSSVFETAIGRRGVLAMAAAQQASATQQAPASPSLPTSLCAHLPTSPPACLPRALGFGVGQWLVEDGLADLAHPRAEPPWAVPPPRARQAPTTNGEEALWQRLLSCSSSGPSRIGWA